MIKELKFHSGFYFIFIFDAEISFWLSEKGRLCRAGLRPVANELFSGCNAARRAAGQLICPH